MKRISLPKGRTIETPWLRIEEAAAYCSISRTSFVERASDRLPHAGDESLKLYNCAVLDKFLANELPEAPFSMSEPPATAKYRQKRHRRQDPSGENTLVDPVNGKIWRGAANAR